MSIYIYKMRYDVRMKLTDILDAGDFWRELGGRRLNYTTEVSQTLLWSKFCDLSNQKNSHQLYVLL